MGLTGLILGIPVFFDIGVFVVAPLVYVAAKRGGRSLVLYAMPMLAGLSMTHAFLPPHPGRSRPRGCCTSAWAGSSSWACPAGIPAWLVAGVWWGSFIGRRIHIEVPDELVCSSLGRPAVPTARLPTVPAVRVAPAVPGAPRPGWLRRGWYRDGTLPRTRPPSLR